MIGRQGRRLVPSGRVLAGSALAIVLVVGLSAAMVPLRSHLSVATTALVLVVPVVGGVATGGFGAGLVATALGFLAFDFVFVPPYYTLDVTAGQDWVALGIYAVVMVVVAQVVSRANTARALAQQRADEVRRLFDLSELLVRESSPPALLETVVHAVMAAFDLEGAALLLPEEGELRLAASAGRPLEGDQLARLVAAPPVPVSLGTAAAPEGTVQAVALVVDGRAIGLLALRGLRTSRRVDELLQAFANHLALALDRVKLRDEAIRARLLEEVDGLRRSLVGAVSHDLRTPLATIKVSATALRDQAAPLRDAERRELLELIDEQADRLDRLVSNVLDMTRIQSGALVLRRAPVSVADLIEEARKALGPYAEHERVAWEPSAALPSVDVDHVLVAQVLVNLVDNALRHTPVESPVTVSADRHGDLVEVSVTDHGPGVPEADRTSVFQMFNRREAGGRGGLGLAIARAFVEAHGQRIRVDDAPGGGARFAFTLPAAPDGGRG